MDTPNIIITPDVRRAFVAGASIALDYAGLNDDDTAVVLERMLITAEEVNDYTMRNLKQKVTIA
jgi:hypothetical protein